MVTRFLSKSWGGGRRYFLGIFILVIFISFVYATTWITVSEANFDLGTYTNTSYNSSGFVQLNVGNSTGNYTSKILDVGALATWNNLSWWSGYGRELPNLQTTENYIVNPVNMTGNVLLMHFNNDSVIGENDTLVYDWSGSLNNGTMGAGNEFINTTSGRFNNSLQLDGTNDRVTVPDSSSLDSPNITNEITLIAWINPDSFSYTDFVVSKYDGDNSKVSYALAVGSGGSPIDEGVPRIELSCDGTSASKTSKSFTDISFNISQITGWIFIAVTSDGTTMRGYMNDRESSLTETPPACIYNGSSAVTIGIDANSNSDFAGKIDEVAIWNRTLSSAELLDVYKRGILRLNLSLRSCNDAVCSGESWLKMNNTSPQNLSVSGNRYFQYKFEFETYNVTYSPQLYNVTINYNSTNPTVSLNSPPDNSENSSSSVIFNCSAIDNSNLENITLYGNWSGGWHANETRYVNGTSNESIFTKTLVDGIYLWNCLAYDNDTLKDWGDNNYTLTIDSTAPTVVLRSPANNSQWSSSNLISFVYNVSDVSSVSNCSLIINKVLNITNMSITKNANQTFSLALSNGAYNWSVNCTDSLNNVGASTTYNLSVLQSSSDYFSWSNRTDRHGKPAGIFNSTPFPIHENITNYTIMNDEFPSGKTYHLGTKSYVDGSFSGYSNGSWANPWKNITAALFNVTNGSFTVIVRGPHNSFDGIYEETGLSLKSGVNDTNRFMIVGYNQERPIINGSSIADSTIIATGDVSNATLQRVKIQDNYRNGIRTATTDSHLNIIDVYLYNNNKYDFINSKTWADGNLYFLGSDNNWIFHTTSERTYGHGYKVGDDARNNILEWSIAKDTGYWYDDFPFSSYYGTSATAIDFPNDIGDSDSDGVVDRGWNNTIRYNIVNTSLYYGVQIRRCPDFSLHHNEIIDACKFDVINMSAKGVERKQVAILYDNSSGDIYSNIIRDAGCVDAPAISISLYGDSQPTLNIYNNLIYDETNATGELAYLGRNITGIYISTSTNNTIINIYNNNFYTNSKRNLIRQYTFGKDNNITIKNNILYGAGGGTLVSYEDATDVESSHNLYYAPLGSIGKSLETGEINTNPKWQEIPSGVYSSSEAALQSDSPAKNNGTTLSLFDTSFNNVVRSLNAPWDIGAFEYNSSYQYLVTIMNLPVDNFQSTNTTQVFNCSAIEDTNLANITLYGNWTGAWHANETSYVNGTSNETTFTKNLTDGIYMWNCLVVDNASNTDWGNGNYTLTVDATSPNVSTYYNTTNNGNYTGTTILNVSVNDATVGMDSVYFNITYLNGTQLNFTKAYASGGYYNLTLDTSGFTDGNYNITAYSNDTLNNLNDSEMIQVMLDNTVPSATLSCSPTTVTTGATVTCTCVGSDGTGSGVQTTTYTASPLTSTVGTQTTTCTVLDFVGKTGTASLSYTVNAESSTGGGIVSVAPSTTTSWSMIVPETPTIMEDFDEEMGIEQIEIGVNSEASDVKVSVTQYETNPVEAVSSGKVYKYFEIATENLEDKLEKGIIVIRVEKNWTSQNDIEKDNVVMFEFNESLSEWIELVTVFTEEDDSNYYYEVELNSFSYFMIGEKVFVEDIGKFDFKEMVNDVWNFVKVNSVKVWGFVKVNWIQVVAGVIAFVLIIVGVVMLGKKRRKGKRKKKRRNEERDRMEKRREGERKK